MTNFVDFVRILENTGFSDVLLPFLLIFVIVFAVLQKTKLLGDGKKSYNVVLAIIMGLVVVIPHVTGNGPDIVPIINRALPNIGIIAVAIVMLLLIIGVFGAKVKIAGTSLGGFIVLIAILLVIYIFGAAAGWGWRIPNWLGFLRDGQTQVVIIIFLIFAIIIWMITKEPKKPEDAKGKGFGKFFNEVLKDSED